MTMSFLEVYGYLETDTFPAYVYVLYDHHHSCIVQVLASSACCPVCQKVFFVRMNLES